MLQIWKYPCAQVIFDSDPAPTGRSVPAQIEEMSQAMIRFVHMNLERQESKVRVTCDQLFSVFGMLSELMQLNMCSALA